MDASGQLLHCRCYGVMTHETIEFHIHKFFVELDDLEA